MYRKIEKMFLVGQVVSSVSVILLCSVKFIHILLGGLGPVNIFSAACFALMGYVCGYLLLYRASVRELRKFFSRYSGTKS